MGAAPSTLDIACQRRRDVVATSFTGPSIVCSPICRLQVAWLELGGAGRVGTAPRTRHVACTYIYQGPAQCQSRSCSVAGRVAGAGGVRGGRAPHTMFRCFRCVWSVWCCVVVALLSWWAVGVGVVVKRLGSSMWGSGADTGAGKRLGQSCEEADAVRCCVGAVGVWDCGGAVVTQALEAVWARAGGGRG